MQRPTGENFNNINKNLYKVCMKYNLKKVEDLNTGNIFILRTKAPIARESQLNFSDLNNSEIYHINVAMPIVLF